MFVALSVVDCCCVSCVVVRRWSSLLFVMVCGGVALQIVVRCRCLRSVAVCCAFGVVAVRCLSFVGLVGPLCYCALMLADWC